MKQIFYTFSALFLLTATSSCLPVLLDENMRTLPGVSNVNQHFNQKENLHLYGDAAPRWISDSRNVVYAGIRTPLRVKVPKNMVLKTTLGQLEKDKVETDLYYLTVDHGGLIITLYFFNELMEDDNKLDPKNTIGDFEVFHLPDPKFRLPITLANKSKATVYDFKNLDHFELISTTIGNDNIEFQCPCTGFSLLRINAKGERFTAHSKTGAFTEEITALVKQAQANDIYVFQNVSTNCGPKDIKRTLPYYTIEIE